MFTLCFTSVAVANLRRAVKTQEAARKTGLVRVVRRGLASVAIVVAAAGFAQAGSGGHGGHGGGGGGGGGSGKSISRSIGNVGNLGNIGNKVTARSTLSNLGSTNNALKLNVNKPITLNKPTTLGNLGNIANHPDLKINNPVLNGLKNGKGLTLNHVSDVKQKLNIAGSANRIFANKVKFCDHCHKCSFWYCWHYPTWTPLYSRGCGYYYDVPVVEIPVGFDLQLLAVRMVDSGDPENQQGPAVRVWFRNNSAVAVEHPFNVIAVAARSEQATPELPQAGVRIDRIDAGQTLSVDIRLPIQANEAGLPMLHVVVDSHREIPEVNEGNNGLVINRGEVLPLEASELQAPAGPQVAPVATEGAPFAPAATQVAPVATQNAKIAPPARASVNGLPNDAPVNGPVAPPVATGAASVQIELPTASDEGSFNIVKN